MSKVYKTYSVKEKEGGWWVILVDEQGLDNNISLKASETEAVEEAKLMAAAENSHYKDLWAITHRVSRTSAERELFAMKCYEKGRLAASTLSKQGKLPSQLPQSWKERQNLDDASWQQFSDGWNSFVNPSDLSSTSAPVLMTSNEKSLMEQHAIPAEYHDVEALASKLGVSANSLGGSVVTLRADLLDKVMQDGALVDLYIGRWRAQTRLEGRDIGIDESSDANTQRIQNEYLALGKRTLLPKELINQIQCIESDARAHLDKHSFKTPWGRFVSKHAWEGWSTRNNELRDKYMAIAERVASESPTLFRQVMAAYEEMAPSIYGRQMKKSSLLTPPADWLNEYRQRIASKFPTPDAIRKSFIYEVQFAEIPIPTIQGWQKTGDTALDGMRDYISTQVTNSRDPHMTQKGFYVELSLQLITDIHQAANAALHSMKNNGTGKAYAIHPSTKISLDMAIARYRSRRYKEDNTALLVKLDSFVNSLDASISVSRSERDKKGIAKALIAVIATSTQAKSYFRNL